MNFILEVIKNLYLAVRLFFKKQGMTLASSSSFYAIITIVPFMLLTVRAIGYFLGNISRTEKYLFILGSKFFPEIAPDLLIKLQALIKGPLFAESHFTLLNFFFLAVTTFTFINSIWMGVFLITGDHQILSLWRILKGFVIIGFTLLMLGLIFIFPPVIIYVIKFFQSNVFTQYLWDNFETLRPMITYGMKINLKKSYWLSSDVLHLTVILSYFTMLYRWLFYFKITLKESMVAALAFSVSMFIGKYLFWIYLNFVRNGLIRNYGDLYTSVVGIIWLLYLMAFFFYGVCVCSVYKTKRDALGAMNANY
jgi:membrane protein